MTRKQMIWEILNNARKGRWKRPYNGFAIHIIGDCNDRYTEVAVIPYFRDERNKITYPNPTDNEHINIPCDYVVPVFGTKNSIKIDL